MKNLPKLNIQLKNPLKNLSRKKKILLAAGAVVLIGVIAVVVSFSFKRNQMKENMEAAFTTETAKIERQTLTNSISATGTIESAETKTVNTKMTNMEVVAVNVKEGDYVEEGTVICEFDASDYEEELAAAKNNQAVNEQIDALNGDYTSAYNEAVADAEEGLQNVRDTRDEAKEAYIEAAEELADEESDVASAEDDYEDYKKKHPNAEADYTAAKSNYEKVQSAAAAVKEAETALETAKIKSANAEKDLKNAEKEAEEKDIDLTDFQKAVYDAEHAVEEAASALEKANSDLDSLNTTEKEASEALKEAERIYNKLQAYKAALQEEQAELNAAEAAAEQTEAQYDQAQSQREDYQDQYEESIEKAQSEYDKAVLEEQLITETQEEKTIDEYTELIEDCVVKASMSGVITSLNVTEGNNFEGGDIYTIQDNENFIVSATVDEYDIASIEKGMTAYVKTDATKDAEMTGEVTYVAIAPASTGGAMGAVSSSASYRIEVTIADPDENLRAGMTAKLSIALEEAADALTVPYDAVTTTPDGKSTITADINGEKKTITVETGLETDYYTEVISDEISEGMTVYLSTPMTVTTPDSDEELSFPGGFGGMTNGGDRPSGGGPSGF